MCLKPLMAATLCPKPLNPHAQSWNPQGKNLSTSSEHHAIAKKSTLYQKSFDEGIKFPHKIYASHGPQPPYAVQTSHQPALAMYNPLHQLTPVPQYVFLSHPSIYAGPSFQTYMHSPCVSGLSYYISYDPISQTPPCHEPKLGNDGHETAESGDHKKNGRNGELLDGERMIKGLLKIYTEDNAWNCRIGFVPPRLRRWQFSKCRRNKMCSQTWKPKKTKTDDGAAAVVAIPSYSPPSPKGEMLICNYTTIMIKNIPNQYRRGTFMKFLDSYCRKYRLEYDFLYLPMDFSTGANLGFAFVNFTTASSALKMKEVLQDFKWGVILTPKGPFVSKKICEVTWARIQGKDALIRHFEVSVFTCDDVEYLPVVLSPPRDGSSSPLPTTLGKLAGVPKSLDKINK